MRHLSQLEILTHDLFRHRAVLYDSQRRDLERAHPSLWLEILCSHGHSLSPEQLDRAVRLAREALPDRTLEQELHGIDQYEAP